MALHERSMESGAGITLVRRSTGDGVLLGRVRGHLRDGRIEVEIPGAPINHFGFYSDEGVEWIRGHWRNGTPAAEALLAAYKLSKMLE